MTAATAKVLTGGCFCGAVRYQAAGEVTNATVCHCSICRRTSGAPMVAWFTVPRAAFRFVAGAPNSFRSSDHGTRTFCPACGTPLTFASARTPAEVDVTTCSLDDPEAAPPQDHTHTSSGLGWVVAGDDLPRFEGPRSGPCR